jgi:hypothetical protein
VNAKGERRGERETRKRRQQQVEAELRPKTVDSESGSSPTAVFSRIVEIQGEWRNSWWASFHG